MPAGGEDTFELSTAGSAMNEAILIGSPEDSSALPTPATVQPMALIQPLRRSTAAAADDNNTFTTSSSSSADNSHGPFIYTGCCAKVEQEKYVCSTRGARSATLFDFLPKVVFDFFLKINFLFSAFALHSAVIRAHP